MSSFFLRKKAQMLFVAMKPSTNANFHMHFPLEAGVKKALLLGFQGEMQREASFDQLRTGKDRRAKEKLLNKSNLPHAETRRCRGNQIMTCNTIGHTLYWFSLWPSAGHAAYQ
jgi:hypothetical protein